MARRDDNTKLQRLGQVTQSFKHRPKPLDAAFRAPAAPSALSLPSEPSRRGRAPRSALGPRRVTKVPTLRLETSVGRRWSSNQSPHALEHASQAPRQVNAGVYVLENAKTGHRFFGTTWDLRNAEAQSFHDLRSGSHPHQALVTCCQLYGEQASGIRFRVLERVNPPSSTSKQGRPDASQTTGKSSESRAFDVRAMERKLAARLSVHQCRIVRRAARKVVRRFLVLPVLERAFPRWRRAVESFERVEELAASVEIQRVARGHAARSLARWTRRDRATRTLQRFLRWSCFTLACRRRIAAAREAEAVVVLQRGLREALARRRCRRRRRRVRRWLAARKLQTQARGWLARKLVRRLRLQQTREAAAVSVQRLARGHLARLAVAHCREKLQQTRAALLVQKIWKGYSTRVKLRLQRQLDDVLPGCGWHGQRLSGELEDTAATTIQRRFKLWQTRRRRLQEAKATAIRLAYRNYVAKKFGWAATALRLESAMASRIQNAGRRWTMRRRLHQLAITARRQRAARVVQCCERQRQARREAKAVRERKRRQEASRRIQAAWRAHWLLLCVRRELMQRRKERAARCIQRAYCNWRVRRELEAIRALARRHEAATKLQCLFRARQARRELLRRQVVRRMGACESCHTQVAVVYHFAEQSELCATCSNALGATELAGMETMDIQTYRRLQRPIVSLQRVYRSFQAQLLVRFGACVLCKKQAVRRSCESCARGHGRHSSVQSGGRGFCHSCDALFHERRTPQTTSGPWQHQRRPIERVYAETQAAVLLQRQVRRFLHRHTLQNLRESRREAAANRIQIVFRSHRQRRLTRERCVAWRLQQQRENYAALTLQRVVRGHWVRRERRRLELERKSAVRIQRTVRAHHTRRRRAAAVTIQRHVRGVLGRRVAAVKRQQLLEALRQNAACCLQRHTRGFLGRRRAHHIRQHWAAIRLQCGWRCYVARCQLLALRLAHQQLLEQQEQERQRVLAQQQAQRELDAATCIQALVRGRLARLDLPRRRLQAAREVREAVRRRALALEAASAVCIQRHVRERLLTPQSCVRLRAQRCARGFYSRRLVQRMRVEKHAAVRIQRAFRYTQAKRRLARLVDGDAADDVASDVAEGVGWVELFDEASGCVFYYHAETRQSVWERPPEMDVSTDWWTPEDSPAEWLEYWDENVGAAYFYNVKTGEATWTTPAGYSGGNQSEAESDVWTLEDGSVYHTLPSRAKLPPPAPKVISGQWAIDNQQPEAGDELYYAYEGYAYDDSAYDDSAYNGQQDNNVHGDATYYYYGDPGDGYTYVLDAPDEEEQLGPVDTEYDINYKIYLTQMEREQQEQQQEQENQEQTEEQSSKDVEDL